MPSWQTIPVFISSTFLDMQAERDVLVKKVFPSLRARFERHRVRIVEFDLRWGITTEQELSGKVLDLCFGMIDKARPLFIALLGERYGSLPGIVPGGTRRDHPWLPQPDPVSWSVTELEVLYGVLTGAGSSRACRPWWPRPWSPPRWRRCWPTRRPGIRCI